METDRRGKARREGGEEEEKWKEKGIGARGRREEAHKEWRTSWLGLLIIPFLLFICETNNYY